jgi:hypothetical protein
MIYKWRLTYYFKYIDEILWFQAVKKKRRTLILLKGLSKKQVLVGKAKGEDGNNELELSIRNTRECRCTIFGWSH